MNKFYEGILVVVTACIVDVYGEILSRIALRANGSHSQALFGAIC
jgi:hypothetical protein